MKPGQLNRLPDKPSELIRLALADLKKVESDPRYEIAMAVTWHEPQEEERTCLVCLAGAVMAEELGLSPEEDRGPSYFDTDTTLKLLALNSFRLGNIDTALCHLRIDYEQYFSVPTRVHIAGYNDENPAPFYRGMEAIASCLEEVGL